MIHQYISDLRTKSHHHKHRVALLTSSVVTGAIFVAWLSLLLPSDAHRIIAENTPAASAVETSSENSPVATLKRQTASAFSAIKDLFHSQVSGVDLQNEYNQMKTQVESGQIKLTPASPVN